MHIYICLYTCIEEWALFVFFQSHKTFYFAFGSKMVFTKKKKKKEHTATAGGVFCHEKYNIYM